MTKLSLFRLAFVPLSLASLSALAQTDDAPAIQKTPTPVIFPDASRFTRVDAPVVKQKQVPAKQVQAPLRGHTARRAIRRRLHQSCRHDKLLHHPRRQQRRLLVEVFYIAGKCSLRIQPQRGCRRLAHLAARQLQGGTHLRTPI